MKPGSIVGTQGPAPSGGPEGAAPALAVHGISKTYGVVRALQSASLELVPGEIHALVGENGSGKSTLVGIVSGTVKPDTGTVAISGGPCTLHTPTESQRRGALTVFQDGSILPELTIAQNLYLGTPAAQRPPFRQLERWAAERLQASGLGRLSVGERASTLSPGDRQLLEIVRALSADPDVLLLDEATSALDAAGVDTALELMRQAAGRRAAVLFVTHRLSEVFRVADRISVLRDGQWQGTHEAKDVTAHDLVELMAGTSVDVEFPDRGAPEQIGDVVLSAQELSGPSFGPVNMELRAGEIVGLAGADDNGQLELLRALATVGAPDGRVLVRGKPVVDYGDAVEDGVLLLSGDRRGESLLSALSIRENLTVGMLDGLSRLGVLSWRREKRFVRDTVERFGIRLGTPEQQITSLSGGNQQKVALGRVLATDPSVLLIDEPTQGVDVRSRMDIYRMLRGSASSGVGMVLVSSDASELAGLCDRVVVVSRGRIVTEMPGAEASEKRIVDAFTGAGHGADAAPDAETAAPDAAEVAAPVEPVPIDGRPRAAAGGLRTFAARHAEATRMMVLIAFILALGAFAQSQNPTFLSTLSVYNLLFLATPLALLAAAQFVVLYVGGIDISVGAAMAVCVVVLSFVVSDQPLLPALALSVVIAVGIGAVIGVANATLVEGVKISPVIATIATLGILQGVGLMLRPTAGGMISPDLLEGLSAKVWIFPWTLLVLAALFVFGDRALRSTGAGLRLRSVGLNPLFAQRLGVNASRMRQAAYVACAIGAALAGVLLAAQVGTGDATVGDAYTLLAIAAPVLGGASLFGGYGTFAGCMLGAVLLVLAQSLTTTLGISDAYGFIFTGALTLLALLLYTAGAGAVLRTTARTLRQRASLLLSR